MYNSLFSRRQQCGCNSPATRPQCGCGQPQCGCGRPQCGCGTRPTQQAGQSTAPIRVPYPVTRPIPTPVCTPRPVVSPITVPIIPTPVDVPVRVPYSVPTPVNVPVYMPTIVSPTGGSQVGGAYNPFGNTGMGAFPNNPYGVTDPFSSSGSGRGGSCRRESNRCAPKRCNRQWG